ncbi:MAG: hypothetical protein RJA99_3307 [Pseudomonadota bacterium]|jgi:hypothetical protein
MATTRQAPAAQVIVRSSIADELTADPVEAKKALETIDIRLLNRPMGLLNHRLYNALIAFAQSVPKPADNVFAFPLDEIMDMIGMGSSNNVEHFVETADQLMNFRVYYNALSRTEQTGPQRTIPLAGQGGEPAPKKRGRRPKGYEAPPELDADQLIASIKVHSARNLIAVEFPNKVRELILRPEFYKVINLEKQKLFSSRAALALYEYTLRYAGERATPWLRWEDYSVLLSGNTEPHKTYREFSKLLMRAVEQVNTHHDTHQVQIEVTKKGARAIDKVRAAILLKHQANLPLESIPEPSPVLLRALTDLGIAAGAALNMARAHPAAYLVAQLNYLRTMQRKGRVRTPAAYFRQALNANYANWQQGDAEQQHELDVGLPAAAAPAAKSPTLPADPRGDEQARVIAAETRALESWLGTLAPERRSELEARWLKTVIMSGIRNGYQREGMKHPLARSDYYRWLRDSDHFPQQEP